MWFVCLFGLIIGSLIFYLETYFKNQFKTQIMSSFQIIALGAQSSYFSFIRQAEIRTIDWSSDNAIRVTTEKILASSEPERAKFAQELSLYLKEKKIVYDPEVLIIDILNQNGIVVASSRQDRIGTDEAKEEREIGAVRFQEAIRADLGEAFATPVIYEEDEHDEPMIHLTARIFSEELDVAGKFKPLDAVILLHFANTKRLSEIFQGKISLGGSLLEKNYQTAEIYLVNLNKKMVTYSRFGPARIGETEVDTAPVNLCLETGADFNGEYINYRNKEVIGYSVCLRDKGVVVVAEAEKKEILVFLAKTRLFVGEVGFLFMILGILGIFLFVNFAFRNLEKLSLAIKKISKGDFGVRIKINSQDEIGGFASTLNNMLDIFQESQKKLKETEIGTKKVNIMLEKKVQEKTMEIETAKINLEKTVVERTKELEKKVGELKRFQQLTIGRELKMMELKKELEELKKKTGYE